MAYWDDGLDERRPGGAVAARCGAPSARAGRRGSPRRCARRTSPTRPGAAPDVPGHGAAQRRGQPSRARCPTASSCGSSRTAPRRRPSHGSAIPDELPVGLTDATSSTRCEIDDEDLPPIDESLRWLVDYAEAERVGMAVTVPLPLPGQHVRRLLVYGVRARARPRPRRRAARATCSGRTASPTAPSSSPQGTPTNNTESARTEWSRRTPPGPPDPRRRRGARRPGERGGHRGRARHRPGAARHAARAPATASRPRAAAFNTALWTTTWGDAIEHLTPGGTRQRRQAARQPVARRGPRPLGRPRPRPRAAAGAAPRPPAVRRCCRSSRPTRRGSRCAAASSRTGWCRSSTSRSAGCGTTRSRPCATVMNRPLDDGAARDPRHRRRAARAARAHRALAGPGAARRRRRSTLPDLGDGRRPAAGHAGASLLLAGVADDALDEQRPARQEDPHARAAAGPRIRPGVRREPARARRRRPRRTESVLQVLLAHADAVERHAARPAGAAGRCDGIAPRGGRRDARPTSTASWWSRALDAVQAERVRRRGRRRGRRPRRRARRPARRARASPTATRSRRWRRRPTVQQVAGVEPQLRPAARRPSGMQVVGELFHARALGGGVPRGAARRSPTIDVDRRAPAAAVPRRSTAARTGSTPGSPRPRRGGCATCAPAAPSGAFIGAYGWLEHIELRTPAAGRADRRPRRAARRAATAASCTRRD